MATTIKGMAGKISEAAILYYEHNAIARNAVTLVIEELNNGCGFEHVAKFGALTVKYRGWAEYIPLTVEQIAANERFAAMGMGPLYHEDRGFRPDRNFSLHLTIAHDDAVDKFDCISIPLGAGIFDDLLLPYALHYLTHDGQNAHMEAATNAIRDFWAWVDERRKATIDADTEPSFMADAESWTQRKDVIAIAHYSRDSSECDRMNFEFLLNRARHIDPDGEGENYAVEEYAHWAVGWTKWLYVKAADTYLVREMKRLLAKMDNYLLYWIEDEMSEYESKQLSADIDRDAEYLTDWFPNADQDDIRAFLDEHVEDSSYGYGDDFLHYGLTIDELIERFGPIDEDEMERIAKHPAHRVYLREGSLDAPTRSMAE